MSLWRVQVRSCEHHLNVQTPLFGLEKLKVYLIKVLLAKGPGPPLFALSSSIKTERVWPELPGQEENPRFQVRGCRRRYSKNTPVTKIPSDSSRSGGDRTLPSPGEQVPVMMDSHAYSVRRHLPNPFCAPGWLWSLPSRRRPRGAERHSTICIFFKSR